MARTRRLQPTLEAFTAISKGLHTEPPMSKKRKQSTDNDVQSIEVSDMKKRKVAANVTTPQIPSNESKAPLLRLKSQTPRQASNGAKRKRDATPEPVDNTQQELANLELLCSSFLSTLAFQYAHNGSSSSLNLNFLLLSLGKAWGVRKVTLEDVRRVIGLIQPASSRQPSFANTFGLKDYGDGKVCIELKSTASMRNRTGHIFDDADLKRKFKSNLDRLFQSWQRDVKLNPLLDWQSFLRTLPMEPLVTSSTASKIAVLASKGQQRLDEVLTPFKRISLNEESTSRPTKRNKRTTVKEPIQLPSPAPSVHEASPPPPATIISAANRSAQLLERVKAKEVLAASLPAGPTKEERERLSALQRASELAQILEMLVMAKGGSRVSFPLASLVTSVQASIRSPMSKEEILRCVKVLQTEVTPGYVNVATFGSLTGVVVDMSRKYPVSEVETRVKALGA